MSAIIRNPVNGRAVTALPVQIDPFGPSDLSFAQPQVIVLIQWGRYANTEVYRPSSVLDWQSIEVAMDGADSTCVLIVRRDTANKSKMELYVERDEAMVMNLLAPDRKVRILVTGHSAAARVLFEGYPQVSTLQWNPDRLGFSVTCLSTGQEKLRAGVNQQITGRFMRYGPGFSWDTDDPDHVLISALPCVFNAGGLPNRAASSVDFAGVVSGTEIDLFLFTTDNAPNAEYWSYADALRYVCYHYVLNAALPIDVTDFLWDTTAMVGQPHNAFSKDPLIRKLTARCDDDVAIQSTNAEEAIGILCARAGLHYQIQAVPFQRTIIHKLRVFGVLEKPTDARDPNRRMFAPRRFAVPRAKAFTDFGTDTDPQIIAKIKAQGGNISIDRRSITRPVFLGGYVDYESTFLLRPGWVPDALVDDLHTGEADSIPNDDDEAAIEAAVKQWLNDFIIEPFAPGYPAKIPTSIYDSTHPDHASVADVFRLWVFPDADLGVIPETDLLDGETLGDSFASRLAREHWFWDEAKYTPYRSLSSGDGNYDGLWYGAPFAEGGGGLNPNVVETWAARRRPFRETVQRVNLAATGTPPIVRIHFGIGSGIDTPPPLNDAGWVPFAGPVDIDAERGAIRFTTANIWSAPEFLSDNTNPYSLTAMQAFMRRQFWVSITATVRADMRMEYLPVPQGASHTAQRGQVIDLGHERFQRRLLASGSHLNANTFTETDPAFGQRDDWEVFTVFADRQADKAVRDSVAGTLSMFYLDRTYLPGDSFTGIPGIGVEFDPHPTVERVRYLKAAKQLRTELVLTDLRHAPEVL